MNLGFYIVNVGGSNSERGGGTTTDNDKHPLILIDFINKKKENHRKQGIINAFHHQWPLACPLYTSGR